MSRIAGVFDETQLQILRAKADEMMLDGRIRTQYEPQIAVINALRAVNTATMNPKLSQIKDSEGRVKKYDVEITWDNACGITAEECTVCDNEGEKLSTNAQQYSLSFCKEVKFTVDDYDYVDNDFDAAQAIAKGLLKADKELVEAYVQYAVAVLSANKGVNQMGTGSKGVVSGSDTYIIPAYWDAKLFAYFWRVAQLNRFSNPSIISGSNLAEEYFTIQKMLADAKAQGDNNLMNTYRVFFDLFNIDSVNSPDLVTYMVSQGATAMASRVYNPNTLETIGASKRWTRPSVFVPEFKYDMFYNAECSNDMVKHMFKTKLTADLFVNPEGCEANNTGILTFICGQPAT